MYALDTNIIVRYIVQDNKEQARKATCVIEGLTADDRVFISCIVLCEVFWVLRTTYKIPREECAKTLKRIISVASFDIEYMECSAKALKNYEKGQADFSDYLLQEIARHQGYDVVLTFDTKAQRGARFPAAIRTGLYSSILRIRFTRRNNSAPLLHDQLIDVKSIILKVSLC
jgi:predicted nucleic-acid-binding protein